MSLRTRLHSFAVLAAGLCLGAAVVGASSTVELPTYPNDLSPAGLRAAAHNGDAAAQAHLEGTVLPETAIDALRTFVIETRALGLSSRSGRVAFDLGLPNVRANDPAQAPDRVGEAQSEVSVCVNGDTVVVAWNDSRAFTVGPSPGVGTLSGFAYSLDAAATFTDGGSVPRALASDNPSGDTDIDTDAARHLGATRLDQACGDGHSQRGILSAGAGPVRSRLPEDPRVLRVHDHREDQAWQRASHPRLWHEDREDD